MGLSINLEHANWLAYVIEPEGQIPELAVGEGNEREVLYEFFRSLAEGFHSSDAERASFATLMDLSHNSPYRALAGARRFFSQRPWTALLLPSPQRFGEDGQLLTNPEFLQELVQPAPDHPGLILQLQDAVPRQSEEIHSNERDDPKRLRPALVQLADIFPAFRVAMTDVATWPGILLWTSAKTAVFLPFGTERHDDIRERAGWIMRRLYGNIGHNLYKLKQEYLTAFPEAAKAEADVFHIVQISDLHIGSTEAAVRLEWLSWLIRDKIQELGNGQNIIPVVSGDIVDTPHRRLRNPALQFIASLEDLNVAEPFFIIGNHDVRGHGFLRENSDLARYISPSKIEEYEMYGITLVGFDSCEEGSLGSGRIPERQLNYLGRKLMKQREVYGPDHILVGVVHHHPIPVNHPEWERMHFYDRWFRRLHEPTVAFENGDLFLRFALEHGFSAVLHGHKHIPRIATCPNTGMRIFGCGSSVGKIETSDGTTRMSINIVSINRKTRRIACRLLMETVPGTGFSNIEDQVFSVSTQADYSSLS